MTTMERPGKTHGKLNEFTLILTFKPGGAEQMRQLVKEKVGDRTVSIDAGGAQVGGGVRFVF